MVPHDLLHGNLFIYFVPPEAAPLLRAGKLTAGTLEAVRDCIGELMKQMPLKECANCKAQNPTIRRCV